MTPAGKKSNRKQVQDTPLSLRLPAGTINKLKEIADDRQISVADLLRSFIRLGIYATTNESAEFLVRDRETLELRSVMLI